MPKRSKSSSRWLERQRKDKFAKQAQGAGNVSRAHFKLAQLDQRFRLVRSGMRVLELGAAPGGWTQYLDEKVGAGSVIAIDTRPIRSGASTRVVEGEYGTEAVDQEIDNILDGNQVDLVLSDMAPNMSGIKVADQARCMELAELCEDAALRWLKPGGNMLVKVFQGAGLDDWRVGLRAHFDKVANAKPEASRSESREHYVVGLGLKKTQ